MISEPQIVEELQALRGELRWMRTMFVAMVLVFLFSAYSTNVRLRWIERAKDQGKIVVVGSEKFEAVKKTLNRKE